MSNVTKIVLKVLIAAALLVTINAWLSRIYVRGAIDNSWVVRTDEAFAQYAQPVEVLLMGSSHMLDQVDPRVFGPGAYNIAWSGQSYIQDYYKLKYVLEETDHPVKTVLLTLDLHGFARRKASGSTSSYWKRYVDYDELGRIMDQRLLYSFFAVRDAYFPYVGEYERFHQRNRQGQSIESILLLQGGRSPRRTPVARAELPQLASARVQIHFPPGQEWFDPGIEAYFEKFLDLAGDHDVRVVVIFPPLTRAYWVEAKTHVDIEGILSRTREVLDARSHVLFMDYHELYFDRPGLFVDSDHLTRGGRAEFSDRLKLDLTERGVLSRSNP